MKKETFAVRAFHLDLRLQVMTPSALHALADEVAGLGFNALIMEWEGSYPFVKHSQISNRFAYTPQEIKSFLAYCKKLKLDVIPLQQCFGHVEYILRHKRYAHLREDHKDFCQLCPLKEKEAVELFKDLFAELAAAHSSKYFHIGCDETYLLGHCPNCTAKTKKSSKSKLFVDYVKAICSILKKLGKTPVIWADMLLHHPEAAKELPADCILVDWNYGWANNQFGEPEPLLKTGLSFWGAPALRSHPDDFYHLGYKKHLDNFKNFIPYCREKKFEGAVLTSWSTSGLYGIEYGTHYEPIDLYPTRNVYPLPAARLLMVAFMESVNKQTAIDPADFLKRYGEERFGFKASDAALFSKTMLANFEDVSTLTDFKKVSEIATTSVKKMAGLFPVKNKKEFDHLLCLFIIRDDFLKFRIVESRFESPSFKPSQKPQLLKACKTLQLACDKTDISFSNLMKGFLHPSEIAMENSVRRKRITLLQERLSEKR